MKNVVVLDDDPDQVALLVHALGGQQCQVRGFSDPFRALSAIVRGPADVLVADLSLSWIGGEDVIQRARKQQPKIQVILVSGHSRGAEVAKAAGVPFFMKPVDLTVLRKAVEKALVESDKECLSKT